MGGLDSKVFAANLTSLVINPLILLLFSAGLLVFFFGLVEFMYGLQTGGERKENGKQHMLWGVVGMFVMASAWAILQVIARTVGAQVPSI